MPRLFAHSAHAAVHFAKDVVKESRTDCAEAADSLRAARVAALESGEGKLGRKAWAAVEKAAKVHRRHCRVR